MHKISSDISYITALLTFTVFCVTGEKRGYMTGLMRWVEDYMKEHQPDLIVLAGYLRKVPAALTASYSKKIINIHPALLPKYGGKGMYGMHVHNAVKAAGETESGITIHYVNEHYDEGGVILQKAVKIAPTDTPEEIAAKVQSLEYAYFPEVIQQLLT